MKVQIIMSVTPTKWTIGQQRYQKLVNLLGFGSYDGLRHLTKCDIGTLFRRIGEPDYDWIDGPYAEVIFKAKMSKSRG
jgi:hypothetical protein